MRLKVNAMKQRTCLLVLLFLLHGSLTVSAQQKYKKLLWADEFNKDGLPDTSKWGYDIGGHGWGNDELQYYTQRIENAIVQNGVLRINLLREDYDTNRYTSARLLSYKKFDFRYGRVEVRAKLPEGRGTWPAIWMLGSNIATADWPGCGEIDIMEHKGNTPGKIYGTLHYPGHSGADGNGKTIMIKDAATAFHIYSVEWSPEYIKIYVDKKLYHTVKNSKQLPFNHNFFIILNVAMGGGFGGAVDPAFTKATMEVDYVRVYQ